MSRVRVGVGIVAVVSGTAWALGGLGFVATSARRLAELLPFLLVLIGISAIMMVVVPRGALAGPVLLIVIGLLGFAAEHRMLQRSLFVHLPAFILIGVGVIIAMSRRQKILIDTGVERHNAVLFPARRRISGEARRKIIARAIFTTLRLDMSKADFPPSTRLWLDVTCIMGRIEIILPKGWKVQAGRIGLARWVTFAGTLTRSDLAPPEQEEQSVKKLVVVNVVGWGGAVVVERR